MHRLLIALSCPLLALPLTAQRGNIVLNGDFSGRTIAPWVASGFALSPGIANWNVDGTGVSRCYIASPGSQTGRPPYPTHRIEQPVVVAPTWYELSLDLGQTGRPLLPAPLVPRVTVSLGAQQIVAFQFPFRSTRLIRRERICVRFRPTGLGRQPLRVDMVFNQRANIAGYRVMYDNIVLRLSRPPAFCMRGERVLGTNVTWQLHGGPNAAFVLLMAPKLLGTPVRIPTIANDFALDPTILFVMLAGGLDGQGNLSLQVPIPLIRGLSGLPLFWQGLHADATGPAFGWETMQAFYL